MFAHAATADQIAHTESLAGLAARLQGTANSLLDPAAGRRGTGGPEVVLKTHGSSPACFAPFLPAPSITLVMPALFCGQSIHLARPARSARGDTRCESGGKGGGGIVLRLKRALQTLRTRD